MWQRRGEAKRLKRYALKSATQNDSYRLISAELRASFRGGSLAQLDWKPSYNLHKEFEWIDAEKRRNIYRSRLLDGSRETREMEGNGT